MSENIFLSKQKNNNVSLYMTKIYFLLAISFIPTIATIFLLKDNFTFLNYFREASLTSLFLFWGFAIIGGIFLILNINIFKKSNWAFFFLLLFTTLEGVILTPLITILLKSTGGTEILFQAITLTFIVFIGMSLLSIFVKNVNFLGQFLFMGLISLFVTMIFNLFFQSTLLQSVLSVIACILFSLFILYDTKKASQNPEISPVIPVLDLYLDILNLFINILNLLKK